MDLPSPPILVCFAVVQEAQPFRRLAGPSFPVRVVVTGMGSRNAAEGLATALASERPGWVITSGFAGGLNPTHATGDLLHQTDHPLMDAAARAHGSRAARFQSVDRVLATAREKDLLFRASGADAVEMESGVIQRLCAEAHLPCLTLRVVSDAVQEDLPLDFNGFMREDQTLDFPRLLGHIALHPGRVPALLRFQRRAAAAAAALAQTLGKVCARLSRTGHSG